MTQEYQKRTADLRQDRELDVSTRWLFLQVLIEREKSLEDVGEDQSFVGKGLKMCQVGSSAMEGTRRMKNDVAAMVRDREDVEEKQSVAKEVDEGLLRKFAVLGWTKGTDAEKCETVNAGGMTTTETVAPETRELKKPVVDVRELWKRIDRLMKKPHWKMLAMQQKTKTAVKMPMKAVDTDEPKQQEGQSEVVE